MTEWDVVLVIIALVGLVSSVVAYNNSQRRQWLEVKENLIENTSTLRELQNYLARLEADIEKRLEKHENRMEKMDATLDNHGERIVKLEKDR